uniref:Uncharacterized protein n=1 Tax=Salix viminalis TaxID=40686 RepID=A0A6N2KCK9_SALVM
MQTRKTLSWIKEEITRSISVSLMIYIITGHTFQMHIPFLHSRYENPRSNWSYSNKPVVLRFHKRYFQILYLKQLFEFLMICN